MARRSVYRSERFGQVGTTPVCCPGSALLPHTDPNISWTEAGTKLGIQLKHKEALPIAADTYLCSCNQRMILTWILSRHKNKLPYESPFQSFLLNQSTHKNFTNHFVQHNFQYIAKDPNYSKAHRPGPHCITGKHLCFELYPFYLPRATTVTTEHLGGLKS